jgi:hypothetical protein
MKQLCHSQVRPRSGAIGIEIPHAVSSCSPGRDDIDGVPEARTPMTYVAVSVLSHVGLVRDHNEDSLVVGPWTLCATVTDSLQTVIPH